MGYAKKLAYLLEEARQKNYGDIYRTGNLIELPLKGELMITGDLHGNRENFKRICQMADLARRPHRHLILQEVIHTYDVNQTSDMSHQLLEKVAALKVRFPNQVHILMGNHELAEIMGTEIVKSGRHLNYLFAQGVKRTYGSHAAQAKKLYRRFFRSLPFAVRTHSRIFISHSTPEPAYVQHFTLDFLRQQLTPENDAQQFAILEEMVWGRNYSPKLAERFARAMEAEVLVVGHEPCEYGYRTPNSRHVIIDSKDHNGCYILIKLNQPYSQKGVVKHIGWLQR